MPTRTEYRPGTPNWIDLASPDPDASRAFYGDLFGWDFEEEETEGRGVYVMSSIQGDAVAGIMKLPMEGMPPSWNSYVSVDDVDATAAKVESAGGSVMMPPMDVMDAGRMAVIVDPTGGFMGLWQAKNHIGAQRVNEHGALTWNELISTDVEKAAQFYNAVFGWGTDEMDIGEGATYTTFMNGDEGIAGAMPPPMEGMPTFWGVYFAVDDTDAVVEAAQAAGASVLAEPMDIAVGRMATLSDPQGAVFSVIKTTQTPE